jgi:hypothetical protein
MTRIALTALAAAALAAAAVPAAADAHRPEAASFARVATVQLTLAGGGHAGTMTLAGAGRTTAVRFAVSGLPARARADARVYAGTRPAAARTRVAALPRVAADARGRASGTGYATAGGGQLPVEAVADGAHIVVLASGGRVLAWGRIPRAEG